MSPEPFYFVLYVGIIIGCDYYYGGWSIYGWVGGLVDWIIEWILDTKQIKGKGKYWIPVVIQLYNENQ